MHRALHVGLMDAPEHFYEVLTKEVVIGKNKYMYNWLYDILGYDNKLIRCL